MVILGGAGSMHGVVLGALIIGPLLELLRDPAKGRILFYIALIGGALVAFRLSRVLGIVLAATVAFGFVVHAIAASLHHTWVAGEDAGGIGGATAHWVIVPSHLASWVAPTAYVGLIALALVLTLIRGVLRTVLIVPTLYLAAFVWEDVMLPKPEATRYIVLGLILIALMILRPNGLLGERRVEIV
jgi:ABC-type branched-subunit amino acid transport system permease subunit